MGHVGAGTCRRMADEPMQQLRASSEEAHQYLPVNHPARGTYRTVAVVLGLVLALLGVIMLVTSGGGWHQLTYTRTTGVFLLVLGVVVVASALLPAPHRGPVLTVVAAVMLVLGLFVLAVYRTRVNVVHFSVLDVCAYWLLSLAVLWCGMHLWEHGPEQADTQGRNLLGGEPSEHYRPTRDFPHAGRSEEPSQATRTDAAE
jgi:hypothetical protein